MSTRLVHSPEHEVTGFLDPGLRFGRYLSGKIAESERLADVRFAIGAEDDLIQ
jgi:hypothetical protein